MRWPLTWRRRRAKSRGSVSMLDTMQLTAIMTDPTPRSAPPEHGGANELLGVVKSDGEFKHSVGWLSGQRRPWDVLRERIPAREDLSVQKLVLVLGSLVLLTGGLVAGTMIASTSATPPSTSNAGLGAVAHRLVMSPSNFDPSPASTIPIPAKPLVALANPTSAHEVFGYAPYWSLPDWQSFPYGDFSTIAYFSVNVNPNGSIMQSGPGWNGYNSEEFVNLINAAHQAGDRVVLTANDFTETSLYTLTHDPNAGVMLGTELLELVQTKGLDGVNLDLEGTGTADQAGLDRLVSQVDFMLHSANPHYQLTMSTYASSAGDPNGFYDIAGLSRWVNAFFVMAYDVSQGPTGTSGENGGEDDAADVDQYVSVVGASKVILGLPLFGYDEPTAGPALGDRSTGPAVPVTYAQAMASGPTYWNAATDTAWTSYQSGGQWHQVFFDNANTLEGKIQLAARSNLLGVGVWALGMEGSDNSVLTLLNGRSVSIGTPPAGLTTSAAAARIDARRAKAAGGGESATATTTTFSAAGSRGHRHDGNGSTTSTRPSTTTSSTPDTTTSTTSGSTPTPSTTTTTLTTGDSGNAGSTTTSTVTPQ
jgi:spore germination protein YaaH